MADRKGDWCQTYTGRQFWPLDPRPEEVCIEDIAHALSLVCRFGGHCRTFYSVAQHSVLVSHEVERHLSSLEWANEWARDGGTRIYALGGLLHDAAEAYIGDMIRPLKRCMPTFQEAEDDVLLAIGEWFGLTSATLGGPIVKRADEVLLATEARDLMGGQSAGKWSLRADPLPDHIGAWSAEDAEQAFLRRFATLSGRPR